MCAATLCKDRLDLCIGRSASHLAARSVVLFGTMIIVLPAVFNSIPRLLPGRRARSDRPLTDLARRLIAAHFVRPVCPAGPQPQRVGSSRRQSPTPPPRTASLPRASTKPRNLCQIATGKGRCRPVEEFVLKLWNESRTKRARIADSGLVQIRSRPYLARRLRPTPTSCIGGIMRTDAGVANINSTADFSRAAAMLYCALADVLGFPGWGVETNCVACITPVPIGVGTATRYGASTRVPAIGASVASISRRLARY